MDRWIDERVREKNTWNFCQFELYEFNFSLVISRTHFVPGGGSSAIKHISTVLMDIISEVTHITMTFLYEWHLISLLGKRQI